MDSFDITLAFDAPEEQSPAQSAFAEIEDTIGVLVDEERYGAGTAQAFCVVS